MNAQDVIYCAYYSATLLFCSINMASGIQREGVLILPRDKQKIRNENFQAAISITTCHISNNH